MAHLHIVHTDLRTQLLQSTSQTDSLSHEQEEAAPPSFAELQILLARAKPQELPEFQGKGHSNPGLVATRLNQQEHYHFERLNTAKSVQASSARDGVRLSARSMVG